MEPNSQIQITLKVHLDANDINEHKASSIYAQEPYRTDILNSLKVFLIQGQATKTVYLVLDNPAGEGFNPSHYLEGDRLGGFSVNPMTVRNRIQPEQLKLRDELLAIAKHANVNIIDPVGSLCNRSECLNLNGQGIPIYKDTNHLRADYVEKQASYIDEAFLNK